MPNDVHFGRRRTTEMRDELGRKHCSRGEKCLNPDGPWLAETEFRRNGTSADGLQWQCKACDKQWKRRSDYPRRCSICDEPCSKGHGPQLCSEHKAEGKKAHHRTQGGYICISRGENPEWHNGWFSVAEMRYMLKDGCLPEGALLQQMRRGSVVRTVRIIGTEMNTQRMEAVE